VKILLDECVDRRLATAIDGHDVKTVPQMGWAGIKNGDLLVLAEKQFEVFVTVDRNLSFQQTLVVTILRFLSCAPAPIACEICARSELLTSLSSAKLGEVLLIGS